MKTTDEKLLPLKNGDISSYSLACGYVQKAETKTRWKEIYHDGGIFHVRFGKLAFSENETFHCYYDGWETFNPNELTKARKFYHSIK